MHCFYGELQKSGLGVGSCNAISFVRSEGTKVEASSKEKVRLI